MFKAGDTRKQWQFLYQIKVVPQLHKHLSLNKKKSIEVFSDRGEQFYREKCLVSNQIEM